MPESAPRARSHWPISILSSIVSIVNLLLPLVLVRILTADEIGTFKIFFLYLSTLPAFALTAGLMSGLAYWAGKNDRNSLRAAGALFVASALSFSAVALLLHGQFSAAFAWPPHFGILFALAAIGAIAGSYFEELAIATGRIWTGAIFYSVFEIVRTAAVLAVAIIVRSLEAVLICHTALSVLKTACGLIGAMRMQSLGGGALPRETVVAVTRYALPVSFAWMFGVFVNFADQLILSTNLPSREFAFYTLGCLVVPPLLILEQSVTRVLIPQLSTAFSVGESGRAARLYQRAVEHLAFLLVPASFGLFVFAEPIVDILFTPYYRSAAGYLQLFAFSYLMLVIPYDAVPRAQGKGNWILKNFMVFSAISLGSAWTLTHYFGAYGALISLLGVRLLMRIYIVWYMRSQAGWKVPAFLPLQELLFYSAICVTLAVGCVLSRSFFGSSVSWFLICGSAFALLYLLFAVQYRNRAHRRKTGQPNVLMLVQSLDVGGLEKVVLDLCSTLHSRKLANCRVLAYDQAEIRSPQNLLSRFDTARIPVVTIEKPPRFSPMLVPRIVWEIYRQHIDVVHTHNLGPLMYGVLAKLLSLGRVRLIHTQHSFVHLQDEVRYRLYEKWFSRGADQIVAVSEPVRKTYAELGLGALPVVVIENGVELPEKPVVTRAERLARRQPLIAAEPRLQQLGQRVWILYLARLHPVKGQLRAIEIWGKLSPAARRDSALIVVGPESHHGELVRLRNAIHGAPDPESIVYVAGSSAPLDWFCAADLFLSCSEYEGLPLAPIEAIGSGLPAVLSAIAGHQFLSNCTTQFSPGEHQTAASAIEKLVESSLSAPIVAAPERIRIASTIAERFGLGRMALRYIELYRSG